MERKRSNLLSLRRVTTSQKTTMTTKERIRTLMIDIVKMLSLLEEAKKVLSRIECSKMGSSRIKTTITMLEITMLEITITLKDITVVRAVRVEDITEVKVVSRMEVKINRVANVEIIIINNSRETSRRKIKTTGKMIILKELTQIHNKIKIKHEEMVKVKLLKDRLEVICSH